ncbi:uncharacterized protein LOC117200066 [Orcinus orca]|uniref:uncharacterized protein LOC117200066 n=1 Tax=Orcinus orca TaxID=9733 RepID=UPI0014423119|nr:uncharacterized protein LOC117200066 [Orcinus orca]
MGANRPLASRRSVAVLTVHGTLSAADSEPAPRPRRVITATRRGSRAPVPALSDGAGTGLSGRRCSREAAGSEPAASPPANPARLCCYSSCVQFTFQPLTPDPASAPAAQANVSRFLHEVLGLATSQSQLRLRSGSGGASQQIENEKSRQVASGTVQWRRHESHSGPLQGSPRARKSSPSHLQGRPDSQSLLTPESSGFSFFLKNSAQGH